MPDRNERGDERATLVAEIRRHIEGGRLRLADLVERLLPEEVALLRGDGGEESVAWSDATRERMLEVAELGDRRRPLGRATLELLMIGFLGERREKLMDLLELSDDLRFRVSAADSAERARQRIDQGGLDAVLLDLRPSPGAAAARLARAEALRSDLPIVSVVDRDDEVPVGALDVICEDELDSDSLARTLHEAAARHRTARALDAQLEKEQVASARDPLTGLPNRASFIEQLARALHYASRNDQQVAVLFLDVAGFGALAGELGGEVRDSLILTITERLQGALRRSELIARVAGAEFLVMLQGRDLDYAPARTAERLIESLAGAFVVDGEERAFEACVGIATHPRDGSEPEALVRHADEALHQRKAEGAPGYRFYGLSLTDVEKRRHRIADRLRGALERGDLRVHYQPCVDARSGEIVGAEALLRWTDAELGDVSPAEFVPIAERSGWMCRIGSFVLREASAALARWIAAGRDGLRVSVNVSAHQVHTASLRDAVIESVMDAGLPPGSLEIELTETALVDNPGAAASLLRELAEIGVSLALDDFGTGFSALSHLRTFPVSTLKIDPSFVREIREGEPFPSFVQAVLSLAEAIGLDVVAEGVETDAQRSALAERGCRRMQGFLFARPMPDEQFQALVESGRALGSD